VFEVVLAPYCKVLSCFKILRRSTICKIGKGIGKKSESFRRTRPQQIAGASKSADRRDASFITNPATDDNSLIRNRPARRASVAIDDGELMSTRDTWIFSVVLIGYVMYPTLVRFPFELLQCRQIGGKLYLERDLQEECFAAGQRHIFMVWVLAVPSLIIYAVGMPLSAFIILWAHRIKLNTNKYRFRLGLLYSGYRQDRWWWELIVAARKVVIISLASFGFNESIQVHLVLGLILILLVIHFIYLPYTDYTREGELLHRVERNSLLALIIMLWGAVVFIMRGNQQCKTNLCLFVSNALVVVAIAVNILLLCYGMYLFIYYLSKRNHLLEKVTSLRRSSSWIKKKLSRASVTKRSKKSKKSKKSEKSVKCKLGKTKEDALNGLNNDSVMETEMTDITITRERKKLGVIVTNPIQKIYVDDHSGRRYSLNALTGETEWVDKFVSETCDLNEMKTPTASVEENGLSGSHNIYLDESSGRRYSQSLTTLDTKWLDDELQPPLPKEVIVYLDEETGKRYTTNTLTGEVKWLDYE
jgi:hypothetical protein